MFIINNIRNILNKNRVLRKLFVKLISPFTLPILILLKNISIKEFRRKRLISSWRNKNPKNILRYESGICFNISANKNSMSKSLILQEHTESNETQFLKKMIYPGQVVVDVGANMGWYSIHFSKSISFLFAKKSRLDEE